MALIDEYKQAIQDVLDGRAPAAPRPSELPWTEDKLAALWAGAAAELIAEANAGGSSGGGVLVVHETVSDNAYTLDKTYKEISDAGFAVLYWEEAGSLNTVLWLSMIGGGDGEYVVAFRSNNETIEYATDSETGYPSYEYTPGD